MTLKFERKQFWQAKSAGRPSGNGSRAPLSEESDNKFIDTWVIQPLLSDSKDGVFFCCSSFTEGALDGKKKKKGRQWLARGLGCVGGGAVAPS